MSDALDEKRRELDDLNAQIADTKAERLRTEQSSAEAVKSQKLDSAIEQAKKQLAEEQRLLESAKASSNLDDLKKNLSQDSRTPANTTTPANGTATPQNGSTTANDANGGK